MIVTFRQHKGSQGEMNKCAPMHAMSAFKAGVITIELVRRLWVHVMIVHDIVCHHPHLHPTHTFVAHACLLEVPRHACNVASRFSAQHVHTVIAD